MDKFLETNNPPKLNQETGHWNRSTTRNETESVKKKKLPTKKKKKKSKTRELHRWIQLNTKRIYTDPSQTLPKFEE